MSYLKVYYLNRRNDPIKHVREAAEVALKRMGGDHAAKCMQVTKVLASEMEFLKQPESQQQGRHGDETQQTIYIC